MRSLPLRLSGEDATLPVVSSDAGSEGFADAGGPTSEAATSQLDAGDGATTVDAASDARCSKGPVVDVVAEPIGPCWSGGQCSGGYPAAPECPAGYVPTRTEQGCGDPNECAATPQYNWALCKYYKLHGYGCANDASTNFVMGVVARECSCE